MPLFIVEAGRQRIGAIEALDLTEAETHIGTSGFKTSVRVLERNGASLWDGVVPMTLRSATADEQSHWSVLSAKRFPGQSVEDALLILVPFEPEE